jgi:hypothetical protein
VPRCPFQTGPLTGCRQALGNSRSLSCSSPRGAEPNRGSCLRELGDTGYQRLTQVLLLLFAVSSEILAFAALESEEDHTLARLVILATIVSTLVVILRVAISYLPGSSDLRLKGDGDGKEDRVRE